LKISTHNIEGDDRIQPVRDTKLFSFFLTSIDR